MSAVPDAARYRQVQRTLWRVLAANWLVALVKLIIGFATGTLAMVADGFHSMMDGASNLIGIAATRFASRPADADHPYGHRRFETLATLAIGGLLLVAAWEILTTALDRLLSGGEAQVGPLNVVVMLGTMAVNVIVVIYESAQGRRLRSDILLADASQTRVDIFVSLSVLVGLGATALGFAWADALIALLIVGLIGMAAFRILGQTTAVLVDRIALDPKLIENVAAGVAGVEAVTRARSRGPVDDVHADIEVRVNPATTAEHANAIAAEIDRRVRAELQGISEVQVQFTPDHAGPKDIYRDHTLIVRAAADAMGLSIHELTETVGGDGRVLEMHVEVSPDLTLAQAHAKVTELEQRVCHDLTAITRVVTHIEPAESHIGAIMHSTGSVALRDKALAIVQNLYPDARWSNPNIRAVLGGFALTVTCGLPGTLSVQEAHLIAEHAETQVRAALPEIHRVTIHTEPFEETKDKS